MAFSLDPALLRGVLDSSPDAVLVVDEGGAIIFANARLGSLLGHDPGALCGELVECLIPDSVRSAHISRRREYATSAAPRDMKPGSMEALSVLRSDGVSIPADISLAPFLWDGEQLVVVAIRDATSRLERAAERDRLIQERDRALNAVDALGKLIPICAWCKNVRSDSGFWTKVEQFIAERSSAGVQFTHGICPECLDTQMDTL